MNLAQLPYFRRSLAVPRMTKDVKTSLFSVYRTLLLIATIKPMTGFLGLSYTLLIYMEKKR